VTTTGRVLLHEQGPALWPEYISLAELQARHRDLGTPLYSTLYQADRGGLAGEIIWRELFRYGIAPGVDPKSPGYSVPYCAVDVAISKRTQADETAIVVGNATRDGLLYVRFVWAGRVSALETARMIDQVWRHYAPVEIGVESVAYQAALVEIAQERYPHLPLTPVTPDGDKFSRFLALGALYEQSRIVHHPTLSGSRFELQLTKAPHGRHDDMVDSLAYLATIAGLTGGSAFVAEKPAAFRRLR
jgi:predicted phage terminase large subunit-like protein